MEKEIIVIKRDDSQGFGNGYDISVYDHTGTKINTMWKNDFNSSIKTAHRFSDYYGYPISTRNGFIFRD